MRCSEMLGPQEAPVTIVAAYQMFCRGMGFLRAIRGLKMFQGLKLDPTDPGYGPMAAFVN
jgi:hypothetical protein